jgi:hypothetical protein
MRDSFFWESGSHGGEADLTALQGWFMCACHPDTGARHMASENIRRPHMKNLMSLMLGLSLLVGATAMFAQDKPADTTTTKTKKAKKAKKAKPTTTDKTTKS